ncbi:hypothetical protein NP493_395g00017 [Ridgeia piscesae]|uniref:Uncharacterized protein n=1 Tax=Ridgeia piscesae TaxID=27915 RepID=A0AAD9L2T3_RIDPI|nr:hypothetical protein NP493_395g00017 [Ridgeia piscesae]
MEIDIAIVQRIHRMFKLACLRFQEDIKLWLSHVEFCKSLGEKVSVGRLFTKMLQIHSREPGG